MSTTNEEPHGVAPRARTREELARDAAVIKAQAKQDVKDLNAGRGIPTPEQEIAPCGMMAISIGYGEPDVLCKCKLPEGHEGLHVFSAINAPAQPTPELCVCGHEKGVHTSDGLCLFRESIVYGNGLGSDQGPRCTCPAFRPAQPAQEEGKCPFPATCVQCKAAPAQTMSAEERAETIVKGFGDWLNTSWLVPKITTALTAHAAAEVARVEEELEELREFKRQVDAEGTAPASIVQMYEEEQKTVARIWKALGIETYEQAEGKEISEIISQLRVSLAQYEEQKAKAERERDLLIESKGLDEGFWGRAASRLVTKRLNTEAERDALTVQLATLREQREAEPTEEPKATEDARVRRGFVCGLPNGGGKCGMDAGTRATVFPSEAMKKLTKEEVQAECLRLMGPPRGYVLIKRGLYWRPNRAGYTSRVEDAGIYSEEESQHLCRGCHGEVTRDAEPAPNYVGDLNACAKLRATLHSGEHHHYATALDDITGSAITLNYAIWQASNATAEDHARAFVFVKSLNIQPSEGPLF